MLPIRQRNGRTGVPKAQGPHQVYQSSSDARRNIDRDYSQKLVKLRTEFLLNRLTLLDLNVD